jgi:hypothetical protein
MHLLRVRDSMRARRCAFTSSTAISRCTTSCKTCLVTMRVDRRGSIAPQYINMNTVVPETPVRFYITTHLPCSTRCSTRKWTNALLCKPTTTSKSHRYQIRVVSLHDRMVTVTDIKRYARVATECFDRAHHGAPHLGCAHHGAHTMGLRDRATPCFMRRTRKHVNPRIIATTSPHSSPPHHHHL